MIKKLQKEMNKWLLTNKFKIILKKLMDIFQKAIGLPI